MNTEDIPLMPPSDWQPITDKGDLAVLGKLGEETCELGSALFRCMIQGIDEREPITGKLNSKWVEEEISDVLAMAALAIKYLNLNPELIAERQKRKMEYKEAWFIALRAR